MKHRLIQTGMLIVVLSFISACSQSQDEGAVDELKDAAEKAGDKVEDAAEKAADEVEDATD